MRAELALLAASIMELPEERVNKLKSLNEFCDCKVVVLL